MHLYQRFFQSSKHLLNSISRIAFKVFFDSACTSSIVSKRCPWSGVLSHEEWVQCDTAHYRDAKTTSCLPKISFETVLSDPLEIPIISARSLIVINTFSAIFEAFVPLINVFLRHGKITESLLQHSERFRNWNFIPQTKFNGTSLLNKFRHFKVEKITFSRLENTSVTMW